MTGEWVHRLVRTGWPVDTWDMDLATELTTRAAAAMSGHLDVVSARLSGQVWLREGRVCTVSISAATPALGMRLVSGGKLSLNSLGTALATQRQNPHMRLGDVLVRMGLVSRTDVEAVAWEQMSDSMATLLEVDDVAVTFTQVTVISCPPAGPTVEELLAAARARTPRRRETVRQVGGSDTTPSLTDTMLHTHDVTLRPEEWAVLCRVDGRRTLANIAAQAGFTTLEAASILQSLIAADLVSVPEAPVLPAAPAVQQTWTNSPDTFDDPSELLRELSELGSADFGGRRRN